jgi:hypothetical protein
MSTIKSSAENLTLNADGANNDIKFQSNGSEVASIDQAGVLVSAGGSTHADNVKAKFGTGDDLEIYHSGSHSFIKDNGTGRLILESNGSDITLGSVSEEYIRAYDNGSVDLYHNGAKKFETSATGVTVTGAVQTPDIYGDLDNAQFTNQYSTLVVYDSGNWEKKLRLNFSSVNSWGSALVSVRFMYNYGTSLDVLYHVQSHAAAGSLTVSVVSGSAGSGTQWTTETTNQYNLELKCGSALNSGALITVCSGTRANQQLVSTLL